MTCMWYPLCTDSLKHTEIVLTTPNDIRLIMEILKSSDQDGQIKFFLLDIICKDNLYT